MSGDKIDALLGVDDEVRDSAQTQRTRHTQFVYLRCRATPARGLATVLPAGVGTVNARPADQRERTGGADCMNTKQVSLYALLQTKALGQRLPSPSEYIKNGGLSSCT